MDGAQTGAKVSGIGVRYSVWSNCVVPAQGFAGLTMVGDSSYQIDFVYEFSLTSPQSFITTVRLPFHGLK